MTEKGKDGRKESCNDARKKKKYEDSKKKYETN